MEFSIAPDGVVNRVRDTATTPPPPTSPVLDVRTRCLIASEALCSAPIFFLPCLARTMSYFLPHLPSGWHVDKAIKSEEDRAVVIRFGHDWDSQCMTMDETLYSVAEKVQNFAVIYLVDITEVPDFNKVGIWSLYACRR